MVHRSEPGVAVAGVQAEVADELIGMRERVSLFKGRLEAPHLELSRELGDGRGLPPDTPISTAR